MITLSTLPVFNPALAVIIFVVFVTIVAVIARKGINIGATKAITR